jgi:hypothetical protein
MKTRKLLVAGTVALAFAAPTPIATAEVDQRHSATGLVRQVREATSDFRDVTAAMAAGYGSMNSCVSGPEKGAMGVHYANPTLVGDNELDAMQPEILVYEVRGGRLRLVAVEFIVFAAEWDAAHPGAPPVLTGQQFNLVPGPNRYGPAAFYELHVWAWKDNPSGMFVDWNPAVSCEEYTTENGPGIAEAHDGHGLH